MFINLIVYEDGKPSVPLTASCLNTIAEECILLLRTLYNNNNTKQITATDLPTYFDSLIVLNLISATEYLANPTLEKNIFVGEKLLILRNICIVLIYYGFSECVWFII